MSAQKCVFPFDLSAILDDINSGSSQRRFYLPFETFNAKPTFNYTLQTTTSNTTTQPKVGTDKQDYHPAETAYITASGFTPGETVELQVLHLDAGADGEFGTSDDQTVETTGEGHEPWQVTDGGADDLDGQVNGSILTTWYVNPDDSANATFKLTATGLSSGEEATHIFTDSVVNLSLTKQFTSVTEEFDVDGDDIADTFVASPGDNVSFTITVTNNGVLSATNVVINDDLTAVLPVGLDVISINTGGGTNLDTSGGGDGNAQTVEVLFNSIAPGASKTITVNAKVSEDNFTPISWSSKIGATDPNTSNPNTGLPEYYETILSGTLFLNLNVQKTLNQGEAEFGFLDFTSTAEVISVNGNALSSGTITASSTLDISTYELHAPLNNGEELRAYGIDADPNNPSSVALTLNPDPGGGGDGGGGSNTSTFLPAGDTGIFSFAANWMKSNDSQYMAALNDWDDLEADGDLSDTTDEQAVIDALVEFISDFGVFRRDQYDGGATSINNGTQTQTITINKVEGAETPTNFVDVLVDDTGVDVASVGSFANLQTALDALSFTESTGLNITLEDSNGDGCVETRLQELIGYNFDGKWTVQKFAIASNVNEVKFISQNGSSNLDLSFQTFQFNTVIPDLIIQGNNAKDTIVGTRFADTIEGGNGEDTLSGDNGDDLILGGNGKDILIGGRGDDTLTGGNGKDTFVFGVGFGDDTITDFNGDLIDLSELSLSSGQLDTNNNGVINSSDAIASLVSGNLVLDLSALNGGTISITGVTSVSMSAVIL